MRMMMGLFDPPVDNPYKHITTDVVGSDQGATDRGFRGLT